MVIVRKVASRVSIGNGYDVHQCVVQISKELNHEALDGILEWSHCWLLYLDSQGRIEISLFRILDIYGNKLILDPLLPVLLTNTTVIVDIKPFHACDDNTS